MNPDLIVDKKWYVIYVRSKHEGKVHQLLLDNCIESSLPTITKLSQWSDRKKKIEVPLFRGYIFVHINYNKDRLNVLQTNGVVKFVGFRGEPSVVPDNQMYWIKAIVDEFSDVRNENSISAGEKIKVVQGPLTGLEGIVTKSLNKFRIVFFVDSIMQGVSVEIDPRYVENID